MQRYTNPIGKSYYEGLKASAAQLDRDVNSQAYVKKALTSLSAGSGAEMIPESWASSALYEIYENSWARQLFQTIVLPQGYKINLPKFSTKLREASAVSSPIDALPSELTSTTAIEKATLTSTEVELTLNTLALCLEVHNKHIAYNVDPSAEARLRQEFVNAIGAAEENLLINGDNETTSASNINYTYNASTNINGVNTATGDNEHLLLQDGLRIGASGTAVDAGTAAFSSTHFRNAIKNMGVYARKGKEKCTFIVSPDLETAMYGFSELATLEKYGPGAAILTGEIGRIYGFRVVVTDKMPCTASGTLTDSNGVRGASGNSYTEGLFIYNDAVVLGASSNPSRRFNIVKKDEPDYDRFLLIGIEDFGFAIVYDDAIVRMYGGTA